METEENQARQPSEEISTSQPPKTTTATTTNHENTLSETTSQQPANLPLPEQRERPNPGTENSSSSLPSKRKLSCSSTTAPTRPLKILSSSLPTSFSFDLSKTTHHHLPSEDPHRIFSDETVKQLLSSKITHDLLPHTNNNNKPTTIPPSITLSLFSHLTDPTLTWRAKLGCFGATIGINFLLPFINGVMLGFGEIAAREFLGAYLGWGPAAHRYYSDPPPSVPSVRKPAPADSLSLTTQDHSPPSFTHPSS
ncbi:hypothetical protein VP01_747g11 [Puccinia sorghi]|uniref:Uncharacterized protein n=1 Tax=Puccinia sorghi TaxID=27349 RepID=A0A0L6UEI0_9BASI|nr:hypothetical protein VP01_747g11 [Puccinia sorghi]